jgi:hypothetical protein
MSPRLDRRATCASKPLRQDRSDTSPPAPSSVNVDPSDCCPKKMSGRWGDRPLGRGGWRVLQPEASPVLPPVPLRSRAAKRSTGAIRPKPSYSGSRNQLPITVAILPRARSSVDSPTGPFFSVLPATLPGLYLVPMYLRRPFAASLTPVKLLEMRRRWKRRA